MADVYVDYTIGGTDTMNGLRYTGYVVDSTSDTTHLTDATLNGYIIVAGAYVWNNTRSAGSAVASFATTTLTLSSAIAGMAAGDTYELILPCKTINRATVTLTRAAGETVWLRQNITHTQAANVTADESGSSSGRISMRGCNATEGNDPWHTGSDVKPVINFNNAAYYLYWLTKNYWYFKNLDIRYTNSSNIGVVTISAGGQHIFEFCLFRDANNATGADGILITGSSANNFFTDCEFYNNKRGQVNFTNGGNGIFTHCKLYSGANVGVYGVLANQGGWGAFIDCEIGVSATHSGADVYTSTSAIMLRNTHLGSSTEVSCDTGGSIYSEDHDGVSGDNRMWNGFAIITRDTGTVRSGGASTSLKLQPTSSVNLLDNRSAVIGWYFQEYPFRVWCPASSTILTLYMRGYTWSTWPTAAQLYTMAEYTSTTSPVEKTYVNSTQTLSDNSTWVGFTTTVVPSTAGWVYLKVILKLYTASCGVYIDPKVVVS